MFENPPHDTLLERLIEASTFGLDDLEQNRQGRMSGLQRTRLALMAILYFGFCTLLFTLAVISLWLKFAVIQSIPLLACLIWMVLCIYGCFYWLRHALPMWEDVRTNKVLRISGPVQLLYARTSTSRVPTWTIRYKIAERFFDMAFLAPQLFPEDQTCFAYYTPRSEIIVGIEPT